MLQVKIIRDSTSSSSDFEDTINTYLKELPYEVKDIQYRVRPEGSLTYSSQECMIIFEVPSAPRTLNESRRRKF